jgi:isopenicillin-N epimerase
MAAPQTLDDDIRKFEEIGTHPLANFLAIADALAFHRAIGPARKEARLLYLRDTWAKRLVANERVRLHTSLAPGVSSGVATFEVDGIDTTTLCEHLWERHKIFLVAIKHAEFQGIRVSPALHTTLSDLERFCTAVEQVLQHGIPS